MDNVANYAAEFARCAKNGEKPVIRVKKEYAESFFGELKREGFEFVKECLERISDPDLRRIIEAIFYSTVAGAAAGALIGTAVGGAPVPRLEPPLVLASASSPPALRSL